MGSNSVVTLAQTIGIFAQAIIRSLFRWLAYLPKRLPELLSSYRPNLLKPPPRNGRPKGLMVTGIRRKWSSGGTVERFVLKKFLYIRGSIQVENAAYIIT